MKREELLKVAKPNQDKMIGEKYGKLKVLQYVGNDKHRCKQYLCKCDCGKESIVTGTSLRSGHTKSCGCGRQDYYNSPATKTHGKSYTKLYRVWASMKSRCSNPNDGNYENYGARGVTVCNEWQEFEPFYKWATTSGYKFGLEIDRIENDGNYEPDNCRWTTRERQNNNKRTTRIIEVGDKKMSLKEWADYFKIHPSTINSYVKYHNVTYETYVKMRMEGKVNVRKRKK